VSKDAELVAIINSLNRLPLFKMALPSLVSALTDLNLACAVLIYDAGSTDGTMEWLKTYCQEVQDKHPSLSINILRANTDEDTSFSAGVNKACTFAATTHPHVKWFLFYETDNWLFSSEPIKLASGLLEREKELAAVGFTVKKQSGRPAGFGCSFPTPLQFLLGEQVSHRLGLDKPNLRRGGFYNRRNWYFCDVVYTSPLLVKRIAWEKSGGLDAKHFPFSDCDIDWSWRLCHLNWRMAVLELDGVVHDNQAQLSSWSSTRVLQFHRARLRLLQRHYGSWVNFLKPFLFLRHIIELLLISLLSVFGYPKQSIGKRWILLKTVANDYEVGNATNNCPGQDRA
jgi:GT2 family glycosyltransferase